MELVVLGTGAADGWPSPFCTCGSCQTMRIRGEIRGQTSALIDDVILLDCGPETPRAAERAGRTLTEVHTILLTHAHPDHVGPAVLLWRSWAKLNNQLEVVGPTSAIDLCRPWVGPADPVTFTVVDAEESLHRRGYTIRTLAATHAVGAHGIDHAAAGAVLYDVTGPDDTRILYATDTGPLTDATYDCLALTVRDAPFDLVLLEETFGDRVPGVDLGDNHHDLGTFGDTLATMRRVGAINETTDVIAIHLGHHNPPTDELNERLGVWGARVVPDGTVVQVGHSADIPVAQRVSPHRALVLGGARSGKSTHAERLLAADMNVTYVATSTPRPDEDEWSQRVLLHQQRRPAHWTTTETLDIESVLDKSVEGDSVLIDCLTLWLTGVADSLNFWDSADNEAAQKALDARMTSLVHALRRTQARVVIVSNEVGSGIVPSTASGRVFRDLLGHLNTVVSAQCESTVLVVAGHPIPLSTPTHAPTPTAARPTRMDRESAR